MYILRCILYHDKNIFIHHTCICISNTHCIIRTLLIYACNTIVMGMLIFITPYNAWWVKQLLPWNKWIKTVRNHCLLWQAFTAHFVSKAMLIYFIDGNKGNYSYFGLICNSMVCHSIWVNSARNAGIKSAQLCLALYNNYYNFLTCIICKCV